MKTTKKQDLESEITTDLVATLAKSGIEDEGTKNVKAVFGNEIGDALKTSPTARKLAERLNLLSDFLGGIDLYK